MVFNKKQIKILKELINQKIDIPQYEDVRGDLKYILFILENINE
jgi:hypothetical protein